jgi:uncharacterized protein YaaR (DUF327 family)
MIEIIRPDQKRDEKSRKKIGKHTGARPVSGSLFSSQLSTAVQFDFDGSIDDLMIELKDQEREFIDKQSPYELARYKSLVQKILKIIIDEGFDTAEFKRRRRDRADFRVITDINMKLAQITEAVVKSNKAFNLLKSVEEIRGLILDFIS